MELVLIHGLGQDSTSWEQVVSSLPDYWIIHHPDLPELLNGQEVTYNHLYHCFVSYCESMDKPFHLCGLSLGGVLALQYAIDHPEKVSSLTLVAAQYEMPKFLLKFQNIIFRFLPKAAFGQMGFEKGEFLKLADTMADVNLSYAIGTLSCPTLILCGGKDHANKKASKKMAEFIPGSELVMIPGAGHEVNTQKPLEFAKTLKAFYRKHEPF